MLLGDRLSVGLAVLVLAASSIALAADGDVVEATGEAQVKASDLVTAKKAATADALKRCIEKVVGVTVQSDFSSEQKEVVKGNQDQFYSSVRDSLTQKSEGFIQSYEVTNEAREGDVLKVTVRAKVYESKVRAEVKKLTDLLAAAGNPKLMLVIQEVYVSPAGDRRVAQESALAAYLEKELLARGFELRGAKQAKLVADGSVEAYDKWLADAGGAAALARDNGADVLIAGRLEIRNKGPITETGGIAALEGQIKIELASVVRGVNAATGEVLSSKPVQMVSMGMSEERAVHRALQGRGQNVVKQTFDDLLADLKESFKKTADHGQSYVVQVKGITSFRKQGHGFMELLKGVSGVASVKQKSFASGLLVIDVAFKGSSNELQERIFAVTEKARELDSLDIEGVSGKQLSFKL